MMRSMTGYGKGEAMNKAGAAKIEIKTLNHRYFEFAPRLPESMSSFEEKIRDITQKKIRRGRVNFTLSFERKSKPNDDLFIDKEIAKRYKALLVELKSSLGLKGELSLEQFLNVPNLITAKPKNEDISKLWFVVKSALGAALKETLRSKEKEGKALYIDLSGNGKIVERSLARIRARSPMVVKRYREKLMKTLRRPGVNSALLDRLEDEVAVFARSCDVSEEVTRMNAHIKSFEETLRGDEAGRKLDFIAQELQRESNTIGAKANDFQIQKEVIKIKGALDKIREQVQNVE